MRSPPQPDAPANSPNVRRFSVGRVPRWRFGLVSVMCVLALLPLSLLAQEKPEKRPAKKDAKEAPAAVTPERESAAYAFVERHHPELADLLKHLKNNKNARPYERAIRELHAVSEKLAGLEASDKDRYELELKTWKLKSRIQLLSARLTMKDDDELKKELKETLAEQHDVRRETLSLEKKRMQDRAKKLDKDIADLDARREADIEKQFKQLTAAPKPPAKPAGKGKTEKPAKSTTSR